MHTGPVIERDLDVFGRTVNLASRIGDAAGPGEVLPSEAVAEAAGDGAFAFERIRVVESGASPSRFPSSASHGDDDLAAGIAVLELTAVHALTHAKSALDDGQLNLGRPPADA